MRIKRLFKLNGKEICKRGFCTAMLTVLLALSSFACPHLTHGNSLANFNEDEIRQEMRMAANLTDVLILGREDLQGRLPKININTISTPTADEEEKLEMAKQIIAEAIKKAATEQGYKDYNKLMQPLQKNTYTFSSLIDGIDGTSPFALLISPGKQGIVVIENKEKPFAPTSFENRIWDWISENTWCGDEEKKSFTENFRIFTLLHEYAHCGDEDLHKLLEQTNGRYGDTVEEKIKTLNGLLLGEIEADKKAAEAHYRLFKNKEFLEDQICLRTVMCLRNEDQEHATQFETARMLKDLYGIEMDFPYVPPENVIEAHIKLRNYIFDNLAKFHFENGSSNKNEGKQNKAMKIIEKILDAGLKEGRIKEKNSQNLAEAFLKSYDRLKRRFPSRIDLALDRSNTHGLHK